MSMFIQEELSAGSSDVGRMTFWLGSETVLGDF